MVNLFATVLVFLAGAYLVGLAALALFAPSRATAFLGAFAGSASAHYLELCVRLALGLALLRCAPRMLFPHVFTGFGWVLVLTTAALFLMPWRWHHRFAQMSGPLATRNLKLFAFGSFAGGILVLLSVVLGP